MDLLEQLEALHDELEKKVSDVFDAHRDTLVKYDEDFLSHVPEPWVYLSFETGDLRATVNWCGVDGFSAKSHNVEIQGLENDRFTDVADLPDAIARVEGRRKECAAYLRNLAAAIESQPDTQK